MSMHKIARFLKINGALDGRRDQDDTRWFCVPRNGGNYRLRYRLWQGETGEPELFVSSQGRGRYGVGSVKFEN